MFRDLAWKGQGHVRGVRVRPMGRAGWGSNPCDRGGGQLIGRAAWIPGSPASPLAPTPTLSRGAEKGRGRERRLAPPSFDLCDPSLRGGVGWRRDCDGGVPMQNQGRPARNGSRRRASGGYGASHRGSGDQIGLFSTLYFARGPWTAPPISGRGEMQWDAGPGLTPRSRRWIACQ